VSKDYEYDIKQKSEYLFIEYLNFLHVMLIYWAKINNKNKNTETLFMT